LDPSTLKVHNKINSNLGLVFANICFLQKGATPREKSRNKIELRNDINCHRFVFQKYSHNIRRIFLDFFENYFLKITLRKKAQIESFCGGTPSRLVPRRLILLSFVALKILHLKHKIWPSPDLAKCNTLQRTATTDMMCRMKFLQEKERERESVAVCCSFRNMCAKQIYGRVPPYKAHVDYLEYAMTEST